MQCSPSYEVRDSTTFDMGRRTVISIIYKNAVLSVSEAEDRVLYRAVARLNLNK